MRSCLSFLVFAAVLLGLLAWFVLPVIAAPVVVASLAAAGLNGTDTQATVTANPPLKLLVLHADQVRIRSSNVTLRGISAASMDLTIDDVGLLDRTFSTIAGTLDGVVATTAEGTTVGVPSVQVSGTSSVADATFTLDSSIVTGLASDAAERATGRRPDAVRLTAPDVVAFTIGGTTITGTLSVDKSGDLIVQPSDVAAKLPPLVLVTAASIEPLTLESVRVTSDGVVAQGRLELAAIGL